MDVTVAILKESSEIESDSVKTACLKLQNLHKQCVEMVNRGLADTGGVMGDVLREHLSALAPLKNELEQETKKVMDLVGDDTNGDDVTDNVARRVNCDLWLNTQNGLVQDCEKNVKSARDALKEQNEDGEESSKTSSSSSSLTPKGIAMLKKLRSDLDATLQYVDSTTKRMKVLVTKIAAKVGCFFFLVLSFGHTHTHKRYHNLRQYNTLLRHLQNPSIGPTSYNGLS